MTAQVGLGARGSCLGNGRTQVALVRCLGRAQHAPAASAAGLWHAGAAGCCLLGGGRCRPRRVDAVGCCRPRWQALLDSGTRVRSGAACPGVGNRVREEESCSCEFCSALWSIYEENVLESSKFIKYPHWWVICTFHCIVPRELHCIVCWSWCIGIYVLLTV
jgi:hypothetical protein